MSALALAGVLLLTGPGQRLANTDADGPGPLYDRPLNDRALRDAQGFSKDVRYYVEVRQRDPVLQGNVKAAAQLYLAPALPVLDLRRGHWYVLVRDGRIQLSRMP